MAHAEIAVEEHVGVSESAHHDVLRRPPADAAHGDQLVDERRSVDALIEIDLVVDDELPDTSQACRRGRRASADRTPTPVASRSIDGNTWVSRSSVERRAARRSTARCDRARCARRRPTPAGRRSPAPAFRQRRPTRRLGAPACARPTAAGRRSAASASSTDIGSASRSSRRRMRPTAGARSRQSASRNAASMWSSAARSSTVPCPCGSRAARAYVAAVVALDTRHGTVTDEVEQLAMPANGRRAASRTETVPASIADPPCCVRWRSSLGADCVDLANGVVELADAAEARRRRRCRSCRARSSRSTCARSGRAGHGRAPADRRRARRSGSG